MEATVWVKIKCPSKLSSRELRKALLGCQIISLSSREDQEFILGFKSREEAAKALVLSAVGEVAVKAEDYLPVRSSGTISSRELSRWPKDELLEEVDSTILIGITRLASNGRVEGSGRFRVDFNSPVMPSEVKLYCGLILQVQQFVPAPLRCRKCLVYRHHENSCAKPRKCNVCAQA